MIVVQHLWSQWTKATRAASAGRPAPPEAAALRLPEGAAPPGHVWVHDLRRREDEDFALIEDAGWAERDDPRLTSLHLRSGGDGSVEIRLQSPSVHRLRSRWPAGLPSPLLTLRADRTARITWNGRFMMSLFGANRSFYYAEHAFLIARPASPRADLFTSAAPDHDIDLRARIY